MATARELTPHEFAAYRDAARRRHERERRLLAAREERARAVARQVAALRRRSASSAWWSSGHWSTRAASRPGPMSISPPGACARRRRSVPLAWRWSAAGTSPSTWLTPGRAKPRCCEASSTRAFPCDRPLRRSRQVGSWLLAVGFWLSAISSRLPNTLTPITHHPITRHPTPDTRHPTLITPKGDR